MNRDEIYGTCVTCGIDLPSPEDSRRHLDETMPDDGGSSHTTRVLNPTPKERARSEVQWIVADALEEACEELDNLVERGEFTEEQVADALRGLPDAFDAWENHCAEAKA